MMAGPKRYGALADMRGFGLSSWVSVIFRFLLNSERTWIIEI